MASTAAPLAPGAKPFAVPAGRAPACAIEAVAWRDMASRIAAWDALTNHASEPNPFFESWYLLPSLEACDPQGQVQILCFEQDGKLSGLLPIRRDTRYYGHPLPHLTGWLHPNTFLGAPLVRQGCEPAFWNAFFDWADSRPGKSLFLHLPMIPLDGALFSSLRDLMQQERRHAALVAREERALLASKLSPEDYLASALSTKKRKELRRQYARLCEEGSVTVERRHDDHDLDHWIDTFLEIEASGWKGNAGSALSCDAGTERIFRQALAGAAPRGRLERLSLCLDNKPIAMLASFLTPPGAYSFKTAFDENYARFSPGVLLQRENLAMLDRPDIAWTDSCASAEHPMIDHFWRQRRIIGRVSIAIGGPLRRGLFSLIARAETGSSPSGLEP